MVLGGLRYGLYLLRSKPAQQLLVGADDAARDYVMEFPPLDDASVMISCGGVYHVLIDVVAFRQLKGVLYDGADMLFGVGAVEMAVARDYLFLDICLKFRINHFLK